MKARRQLPPRSTVLGLYSNNPVFTKTGTLQELDLKMELAKLVRVLQRSMTYMEMGSHIEGSQEVQDTC